MMTTMSDSKKSKKDIAKNLAYMKQLLDEQRLLILYLNFDVEATRREREYWKKQVGDK